MDRCHPLPGTPPARSFTGGDGGETVQPWTHGASLEVLTMLADALPATLFVKDARTGRYLYMNRAAEMLVELSPDAVIGRTDVELFGEQGLEYRRRDELALAVDGDHCTEGTFHRADGRVAIVRTRRRVVDGPDRPRQYLLCVTEDVTEARQAQAEVLWLARHDSLTRLLNRDSFIATLHALLGAQRSLAMLSIDLDRFKAVNDRFGHLAGDAVLAQVAERLRPLLGAEDILARVGGDEFALIVVDADPAARARAVAEAILVRIAAPITTDAGHADIGASIGIAVAPADACSVETLRRHADLALYAAKRGGAGAFRFHDAEAHAVPKSLGKRLETRGAAPARGFVAVMEIDRFAALRQRIGYALANALIRDLAERLRTTLNGCQLGRVGRTSVEFAFDAASVESAGDTLRRLVAALEQPFTIDGYTFDLSLAVGAVDAGDQVVDDRQLDRAAAALLIAQERHEKVRIVDFADQPASDIDQLVIMRELPGAMRNGEISLYYQPKLRARTDTIDSAEALLRWHHPEFGLLRTDKVIELAEATGAIRDLTFWVIDRALADRARLADGGRAITIFVNISGILLPDTGFADWALARLADAGGTIGFEITETAVIHDPQVAIANLQRFAAAGIKIAIDDYGSGLSSLAYLKQLPADELKIDRMFVSGLTESHRDPLLVRSSIDLAHALEMEVTAEGVDDPISLSLLRIMGCDMMQGYLISPPLPLEALAKFLHDDAHLSPLHPSAAAIDGWPLPQAAGGWE
ncbi:EAL domain-containing protein [Sphingomonas sp.]|uniref:EAL domain-containing protein n=1 Tax=Sphingomonas sp. TaxID=28214 RepID=UPI0035BC68AB